MRKTPFRPIFVSTPVFVVLGSCATIAPLPDRAAYDGVHTGYYDEDLYSDSYQRRKRMTNIVRKPQPQLQITPAVNIATVTTDHGTPINQNSQLAPSNPNSAPLTPAANPPDKCARHALFMSECIVLTKSIADGIQFRESYRSCMRSKTGVESVERPDGCI